MLLEISYVDGIRQEITPGEWPDAPAEGVDLIELVADGKRYRLMGHSIYWLREDGDTLLLGGGDVIANPAASHIVVIEEVHYAQGRFYRRVLDSMPDVKHWQVKLGWWA